VPGSEEPHAARATALSVRRMRGRRMGVSAIRALWARPRLPATR
jgi:hypothetical protein